MKVHENLACELLPKREGKVVSLLWSLQGIEHVGRLSQTLGP